MPIKIFKKEKQANGNFNNGEILEKKPLGFPQDGGLLKPYSNIFYWAHAWAPDKDSTIGLHPHRGFEICSFVINGEIEHYDTLLNKWITLNKGDIQVIKAGKGISHSERLKAKSEIFQIWFDPNIQESLYKDPHYHDFKSTDFKSYENKEIKTKVISNEKNQLKLDSNNIEIYEHLFENGSHDINIKKDSYHSIFILSGTLSIDQKDLNKGDFVIVEGDDLQKTIITKSCKVFEIISPINLSYKTYAQIHSIN